MQEYIRSALKTETNFHTTTLQSLIKKIVVSVCRYMLLSQNIKSAFPGRWKEKYVFACGCSWLKFFLKAC